MNSNTIKVLASILVIGVIGFAVYEFGIKNKNSEQDIIAEQIPTDSSQTTGARGSYKDGTYSATGQYQSPAALESVDITITLSDGVITAAEFVGHPSVPTTELMQGKFSQGFEEEVVGKPIDEVALTVVNGSSLTPKGFMDALNSIKEEARS